MVDTTEATTQPDLFAPEVASGGGGPENTLCNGRAFGKTVWYDVHPDVDGALEIQTGGFDVAIDVYEFNNQSAKILRSVACSAETGTQDFIVPRIEGKRHYTIQVGGLDAGTGLGPVGGNLGISFQFFADRDDDGVFDPIDDCPDLPGHAAAAAARRSSRRRRSSPPLPTGERDHRQEPQRLGDQGREGRSALPAAAARATRRGPPASCPSRCCAVARCRRAP